MKSLIIGYGNTLRRDDGVGQIVAQKVAQWNLPKTRSLSIHQLIPELAYDISEADLVIFVDGAYPGTINNGKIKIQRLKPKENKEKIGHYINPRSLLFLTENIYGKYPLAYWILLPTENFDFGENLSYITHKSIPFALEAIEHLITQNSKPIINKT